MKVVTFGPGTIMHAVAQEANAAAERGEILIHVELDAEEYARLHAELDVPESMTIPLMPPRGLPIFVDGKSMMAQAQVRQHLLTAGQGAPRPN